MKLLLDEMFSAAVAVRLRERGHDAASVAERLDLRGRPDVDIFAIAQDEQRAVVTENVRDFRPLAREWLSPGKVHYGLVLTTDRRYPRARPETIDRLVGALDELLIGAAGEASPSNRELWL